MTPSEKAVGRGEEIVTWDGPDCRVEAIGIMDQPRAISLPGSRLHSIASQEGWANTRTFVGETYTR